MLRLHPVAAFLIIVFISWMAVALIIIMSRLQNLRYKEIAIRLNVSPNTVENQMSIALRKLKVELKDYLPLLLFIV